MEFIGVDPRRMTFSWVSASEGAKWKDVVNEAVSHASPARPLRGVPGTGAGGSGALAGRPARRGRRARAVRRGGGLVSDVATAPVYTGVEDLRRIARELLEAGDVRVIIG